MKRSLDIIADSLSGRNIKDHKSLIIRQKYLHELACLIFDESQFGENILQSLCDSFENMISARDISLTQDDMLFVTEDLSEMLSKSSGYDLSLFSLESAGIPKKLSYVKNMFSDSAFSCFDKKLGPLRCEYCDSFDSAASGVFFEQYDGCILPFESTHGNIMAGVMNIVNKYSLKKAFECTVSMPDNETVKFGIFSTDFVLCGENNSLDILLDESELFALSKLAIVSKKLGAISGISHRIILSGEGKTLLSLRGDRKAQFALMLYMTLSGIRYDIIGSYREISI